MCATREQGRAESARPWVEAALVEELAQLQQGVAHPRLLLQFYVHVLRLVVVEEEAQAELCPQLLLPLSVHVRAADQEP